MAGGHGSLDPGCDIGGPTMFARIGVLRALTVGMATPLSGKIVR